MKNALTRKFGPLPAWAWLLLLAAVVYYYRKYRASTGGGTSTTGTGPDLTPPTPQDPVVLAPGERVYDPNTGDLLGGPQPGGSGGGHGGGNGHPGRRPPPPSRPPGHPHARWFPNKPPKGWKSLGGGWWRPPKPPKRHRAHHPPATHHHPHNPPAHHRHHNPKGHPGHPPPVHGHKPPGFHFPHLPRPPFIPKPKHGKRAHKPRPPKVIPYSQRASSKFKGLRGDVKPRAESHIVDSRSQAQNTGASEGRGTRLEAKGPQGKAVTPRHRTGLVRPMTHTTENQRPVAQGVAAKGPSQPARPQGHTPSKHTAHNPDRTVHPGRAPARGRSRGKR